MVATRGFLTKSILKISKGLPVGSGYVCDGGALEFGRKNLRHGLNYSAT